MGFLVGWHTAHPQAFREVLGDQKTSPVLREAMAELR
jgi:hypothetical protein